jgi:hypothetical protein
VYSYFEMKIRIGNLELTDITPNELDELVKRYGNAPINAQNQETRSLGQGPPAPPSTPAPPAVAGGAADTVLLKKLVDAGTIGMTTNEIGTILGRRGKAAKKALDEWGVRIGLPTAEHADNFEFARVGSRRGWRLKESLLDVGRHILANIK